MGKEDKSWQEIAEEIAKDVKNDNNVGFLTLGDPSVYSTFSYIAEMLAERIDIQTIAGISSFSQIAASLSVPLMLDEESLEILPATADITQLEKAIDLNDNVVIMKIATRFAQVYKILEQRDLLSKTIVVENASMEKQKKQRLIDYSVNDKLPYFSTALLKKGTKMLKVIKKYRKFITFLMIGLVYTLAYPATAHAMYYGRNASATLVYFLVCSVTSVLHLWPLSNV